MATQMMVRIAPEVKSRFNKLARVEGKTSSQMVRELRGDYDIISSTVLSSL